MLHFERCNETTGRRHALFTRHASARSQQRGLPKSLAPVIAAFGERSHDGRGGIRYLMTGKSMAALVRALGRNQQIDALAGSYVIFAADDEQTVITIGHRDG